MNGPGSAAAGRAFRVRPVGRRRRQPGLAAAGRRLAESRDRHRPRCRTRGRCATSRCASKRGSANAPSTSARFRRAASSTGADGRATLIYTAPAAPAVTVDTFTIVDIGATPIGTDFNNAVTATGGDSADAARRDRAAGQSERVVHADAGAAARRPDRAVRRVRQPRQHRRLPVGLWRRRAFELGPHDVSTPSRAPGTYVVRLTLVDPFGRAASTAQSVTVSRGAEPERPSFVVLADAGAGRRDGELQRSGSRPARRNARSSAIRGTSATASPRRRPASRWWRRSTVPPGPTRSRSGHRSGGQVSATLTQSRWQSRRRP